MRRYVAVLGGVVCAGVLACALVGCGQTSVSRVGDETGAIELAADTDEVADGLVYDATAAGAYAGDEIDIVEPLDTEEYAAVDENGFTSVATNPFSTFSADVDTASYCNLRRMIDDGYAVDDIPDGAVRIEEMLNYFKYDYAQPEDGELFGVTAAVGDCPWNEDTKLLVMGLQTQAGDYAQGKGNNLVFLIDTSGSMDSPDKLPLLQESFSYLVDQLDPSDTVSVVTYSGEERVVLDGVSAQKKGRILRAIRSLEADGCTNGQAGLAMAYELAEDHFVEGGNNRIILASDGDLNVGMTSESELSDYVAEMRESGVYLSVLGFGTGNYKDTKMETIADDGNGAYYYIDCIEEAERVFGEDLCATMVTLAEDVKLQIEFNPAYVKGYRQIGYENRALATDDFKDDSVDAGEVGAGHSVTVAYELVMTDSDLELTTSTSRYGSASAGVDNGEWLTLAVRYKEPGTDEATEREYPLGEEAYSEEPGADWEFASKVIEVGMLAGGSEYAGELDLATVSEELDEMELTDERRVEFADLVYELAVSSRA